MKTSFRILAACLAASLALVSCEKESTTKTDNGGEAKDGARTITVSFSPSTKSTLGNDGVTPGFTTGDLIKLADKGGTTEEVSVTVTGNTATITTTLTGELTAVYPASASDDGINYTVSSSQDGTFAKANICKATIPAGSKDAVFENQTAILKFSVPAKADDKGVNYSPKTIKVKSRGSNSIASDDSKEITISGTGTDGIITPSDGGFYYMAVLPGETISNLTICSGEGMRNTTPEDEDAVLVENNIYDVALPVLNGHEYVELTMTVNSVTKTYKWATTNVGASSSTEYGQYFMWGETTGHYPSATASKGEEFKTAFTGNELGFAWDNYTAFTNGVYSSDYKKVFTKYVPNNKASTYGNGGTFCDNKSTLEPEDDAARQNWGSSWRMPTKDEFSTLQNLTNEWVDGYNDSGVSGRKFSENTNSIFLPAAGDGFGTGLRDAVGYGYYWSSSLDTDLPLRAFILYFTNGLIGADNVGNRFIGYFVRPLSE